MRERVRQKQEWDGVRLRIKEVLRKKVQEGENGNRGRQDARGGPLIMEESQGDVWHRFKMIAKEKDETESKDEDLW